VLLAYTLLREHLESQLRALSSYELVGIYNDVKEVIKQQIMLKTNTLNAEAKLLKYRLLLTSLVYFAALVLVPWNKWRYMESNLTPAELIKARSKVQTLWNDKYAQKAINQAFPVPLPSYHPPVSLIIYIIRIGLILFQLSTPKASLLRDHMRASLRAPASNLQDEYTRYCRAEAVEEWNDDQGGFLGWWQAHEREYPRLAQMARDIFSIPGMSAEVERLFSSAKLMLPPARNQTQPDGMEAGECIRSWSRCGLIMGDFFEYLPRGLRSEEHFRRKGTGK
jgi:hAT family C-terminal dimerisation region